MTGRDAARAVFWLGQAAVLLLQFGSLFYLSMEGGNAIGKFINPETAFYLVLTQIVLFAGYDYLGRAENAIMLSICSSVLSGGLVLFVALLDMVSGYAGTPFQLLMDSAKMFIVLFPVIVCIFGIAKIPLSVPETEE